MAFWHVHLRAEGLGVSMQLVRAENNIVKYRHAVMKDQASAILHFTLDTSHCRRISQPDIGRCRTSPGVTA